MPSETVHLRRSVERRIPGFPRADEREHARNFRRNIAKIFCSAHGRDLKDIFFSCDLPDIRNRLCAEFLIRIGARRMEYCKVICPVPRFYIMVDQLRDPLFQMFRSRHILRAQADVELRLIRDDVDGCPALRHAAGQRDRGCGIRLSRHEQIDCLINLIHDHERVGTQMRLGAVSAPAVYLQDKCIKR